MHETEGNREIIQNPAQNFFIAYAILTPRGLTRWEKMRVHATPAYLRKETWQMQWARRREKQWDRGCPAVLPLRKRVSAPNCHSQSHLPFLNSIGRDCPPPRAAIQVKCPTLWLSVWCRHLKHVFFNFILHWSTADEQHCDSSGGQQRDSAIYVHVSCMHSPPHSPPIQAAM